MDTPEKKALTGIIRTNAKGMGFVSIEGFEDNIVIQAEFVNMALNGDVVEIILEPKSAWKKYRGKVEQSGQVVKIITRTKKDFVGVLKKENDAWFVQPDDRKIYVSIKITETGGMELHEGLKVLARITAWEKHTPNPVGAIVKIIGEKGTNEAEIQSIILDRGIDTTFPDAVTKEAEGLERTEKPLNPKEVSRRRDFRQTPTFTIDPADAKDFDDAISFKKVAADANGDELFEIGVHIADVSYYVREGTELDAEARKRATSIYMVDRTIPMLPEVLSNDLCSLNPNEEKFTFSAAFIMNAAGEVKERWFGRTVIKSWKRFTYETAQDSINAQKNGGAGEYSDELTTLNMIAKVLQKKNYNAGAINFEQDEVRFKLDENDKPISVYRKARLDTHKLVEEYMLLANREVAAFISKSQEDTPLAASIYRIHDRPDSERIGELSIFLRALGYNLPVNQGKVHSQDINKMLASIEGKPEESLIKTATIRSMAKAIYSTDNIGHFGLGFAYYTHFTSPIRRYPDLVVHRVLDAILEHKQTETEQEMKLLGRIATHSTEKEIAAAEAERASIKYKQVEYMSAHVGETFNGVISGVIDWGVYVEDEMTKCEGMVPIRELGNDYFIFNKKTYSIEGERTKKIFRLGDKVKFRVVNANLDSKTLDYALVESK